MKKIESVTSHNLYPPPPVTNCHTFLDPSPWSMTYFMEVTYFMDYGHDILYGRPLSLLNTSDWLTLIPIPVSLEIKQNQNYEFITPTASPTRLVFHYHMYSNTRTGFSSLGLI